MKYSEPKITIDLSEYNDLHLQIQRLSGTLSEGELSETIIAIVEHATSPNSNILKNYCSATGIEVRWFSVSDPKERIRIRKV